MSRVHYKRTDALAIMALKVDVPDKAVDIVLLIHLLNKISEVPLFRI